MSVARDGVKSSARSIGIIVPSANVVVERATMRMLAGLPGIAVHFSRVPVRGDSDPYTDGYDVEAFEAAASLLADTRPDVILWAGSKGVLVGIDRDEALGRRLKAATGVPFTSASLALLDWMANGRRRRIGLITPYSSLYQRRLIAGFARLDLECVAEAHAGVTDNLAYADIGPAEIGQMASQVAAAAPEAIVAWCTNFDAAGCSAEIERTTGIELVDANLLGFRHALSLSGKVRQPLQNVSALQSANS